MSDIYSDSPELTKMAAVQDKALLLSEFYDWLQEEGFVLAQWNNKGSELHPSRMSPEELFAGFFDINLVKVEKEKRAMLARLRASVDRNYALKKEVK